MDFSDAVQGQSIILTEGALIERLRRDPAISLDPYVLHAGLVYDECGRGALRGLYRQYLDIGVAADLPMIVCTPTWRANPVRSRQAGLADRNVNADAARFVATIREEYGAYARRVFLGGLLGCMGDAYKPEEGLAADEAAGFHGVQAKALAMAGVDFLFAATLPNTDEALGMAQAMAACRIPYVVSFVLQRDGRLLDGIPLHQAVARIDEAARPRPLFYMANCVHPHVFEAALTSEVSRAGRIHERVIGLQANTSTRSPEELDGLAVLDAGEAPAMLADAMLRLYRRFRTKILGGCCGTDHRHINWIARRAQEYNRPIL
jgi:homocysteine S-methyltransferase